MRNAIKSTLIILFLVLLQLSIYQLFLKSAITTWGASDEEVSMSMAGDDDGLAITSTRAIIIDAPKSQVWKWLIQLGADRGGFYSYYFIESALGYQTRHQDVVKSEFKEIVVGDVVRGSINEESSIIPYNFAVTYVEPENTFVLKGWGTFLLHEVSPQKTRLIIRTQAPVSTDLLSSFENYIAVPFHYIMERRTLMGIKARVEAGDSVKLSASGDILWFSGVVLSGLLLLCWVYMSRGIIQSIILPAIFSICWIFSLFILDPILVYSVGLLLVMCGSFFLVRRHDKSFKVK